MNLRTIPLIKRVFVTLFLAIFSAMVGIGIIIPFLPLYAQTLGASGIWLGIIFSGFSISRSIFMPVIGRLSDKRGRKVFICVGLFGYALISFGFIHVDTSFQLAAIRFLQGFFAAMIIPIAMAYIGEISPENKEGTFMGIFHVSLFAGFGVGPFMGGAIKDYFGMDAAFYAMGGLSFAAFVMVLLFLPELDLYKKSWGNPRLSYRVILGNNVMRGITAFRLVNAMGRGMVATFLPVFAHQYLQLSGSEIGLLVSANILLTSLLQAPFGRLADRMNRLKLVIGGCFMASLAIALIPYCSNFAELLVLNMAMGFAGAMSLPAATAMTVKEGRELGMGSVMGVFNMAMSVGLATGPLLGGLLLDSLGIHSIFLFGGIAGFTAIGLLVRFT
ncbi:MAG: MFS transporter, partial [Thermodesulfobacteriota bacterium]|nr:MFS transporter [Thermodesulfobacteriota bacterium]